MQYLLWSRVLACAILTAPALNVVAGQVSPQAGVIAQTAASTRKASPRLCFDEIFYGPMPGKTDYCLGMRAWNAGHYSTGLEFLKLAAGWGNKNAQYTLGLIYYNGYHLTVNLALGMAWLKLANQRHNDPEIEQVTYSVIKLRAAGQRRQANLLYQKMRKTYGDKVATARAWHHLRHWQRAHSLANSTGCDYLYGQEAYAAWMAGVGERKFFGKEGLLVCVKVPVRHLLVQKLADKYFQGWIGHVTVGPLQPVPAPASSSGH